jgi:hypothetical protein
LNDNCRKGKNCKFYHARRLDNSHIWELEDGSRIFYNSNIASDAQRTTVESKHSERRPLGVSARQYTKQKPVKHSGFTPMKKSASTGTSSSSKNTNYHMKVPLLDQDALYVVIGEAVSNESTELLYLWHREAVKLSNYINKKCHFLERIIHQMEQQNLENLLPSKSGTPRQWADMTAKIDNIVRASHSNTDSTDDDDQPDDQDDQDDQEADNPEDDQEQDEEVGVEYDQEQTTP